MIEMLKSVNRIRQDAMDAHERLAKQHGVAAGEPPLGGLGMVHNTAVMCLELLHYYHQLWGKLPPTSVPDPERTPSREGERVMSARPRHQKT